MAPKSISVHSLIEDTGILPDPPHERDTSRQVKTDPSKSPDLKDTTPQIKKSRLASIIGEDFIDFPFSENAFIEAVKLKVEQEKTRQEQIKLDIVKKNHDIITSAINANIPGNLIPGMCITSINNQDENPSISHSRSNSNDYSSIPMNYKFGGGSLPSNPQLPPTSNLNQPPSNLRRPLSPAKLGAQAVANLNSPSSSYIYLNRKQPLTHQRHYSMPAVKNPSIELGRIETQTLQYQQQQLQLQQQQQQKQSQTQPPQTQQLPMYPTQYQNAPPLYPYPQMYQYPPIQPPPSSQPMKLPGRSHSRSRSTSSTKSNPASMQVKPTTAQNLQKSSRLTNPPSQESMTSLQHVIQFQHWKPEDPSGNYDYSLQLQNTNLSGSGSGSGSSAPANTNTNANSSSSVVSGIQQSERSHKRHKSNMDNMSVDLGINATIHEEDISMEERK